MFISVNAITTLLNSLFVVKFSGIKAIDFLHTYSMIFQYFNNLVIIPAISYTIFITSYIIHTNLFLCF